MAAEDIEIPPDKVSTEPKEDLSPFFAKTRYAAATTLIAINVLVFVAMAISSQGASLWAPKSTLLLSWGAMSGPYVFNNAEYWRLFTSLFIHIGLQHLLYNMFSLLSFGIIAESLFGSRKFVLLYLLSGLGGGVMTALFNAGSICCGASGAILGLYGGLVGFVIVCRKMVSKTMFRKFLRSIFLIIAWYALYELLTRVDKNIGGVDHAAHIGGFIFGCMCAWIYEPSRSQKLAFHPIVGTICLLLIQGSILTYATTVPFDSVKFKSLCTYLRMNDDLQSRKWEAVIKDANELIGSESHRITGFRFLSRANLELNHPQAALEFADEGLRTAPNDFGLWEAHDAALVALGNKDKCLQDLDDALKARIDDSNLLKREGLVKLKIGDFAGAAKDFHKLIFTASWWETDDGLYEAIPAIVAYRLDGNEDAAKKIVDEALKMVERDRWPYPIFEYLGGKLNAEELSAKASDPEKMTEAKAYIGLTFATYKTAQEQAMENLQWVVDHGDAKSMEYDFAKAQLARMQIHGQMHGQLQGQMQMQAPNAPTPQTP